MNRVQEVASASRTMLSRSRSLHDRIATFSTRVSSDKEPNGAHTEGPQAHRWPHRCIRMCRQASDIGSVRLQLAERSDGPAACPTSRPNTTTLANGSTTGQHDEDVEHKMQSTIARDRRRWYLKKWVGWRVAKNLASRPRRRKRINKVTRATHRRSLLFCSSCSGSCCLAFHHPTRGGQTRTCR